MKAPLQRYGDALVLSLHGRLDHETTPEFREVIAGAVRRASGEQLALVLDLENLEYLSSPGVNCLVIASRNARKEGLNIHAGGLQEMVQQTWDISHLALMVQTFPTLEEALQVISDAAASAYAASKAGAKS